MKARVFGILAVIAGVAALTCTIVGTHILEESRPRTQTKITVKIGRFKLVRESRTPPEDPAKPWLTPQRLRWCGIGVGALALFLSALSWIRREGLWLGFAACTFAAAAMAWKEFVIAFALLFMSGLLFAFVPAPLSGSSSRKKEPVPGPLPNSGVGAGGRDRNDLLR